MTHVRKALLLAGCIALAGCGSTATSAESIDGSSTSSSGAPATTGDDPTPQEEPDGDDPATAPTGTVRVRLEKVEGFFIEGFEIGLRFETGEGEVLASTLWSDFVVGKGNPNLEDFYTSVLEQIVPVGDVVVLATVSVGSGPGPVTPDLTGDLDCRLPLEVVEGEVVDVEVSFGGGPKCLLFV